MDKLTKLTQNVRKWNMMGHSLLPELQLVIIANAPDDTHVEEILKAFEATKIDIKSDGNDELSAYVLFILKGNLQGRVHVVKGLLDSHIKDEEFRGRKKAMDQLLKHKDAIFVVFSEEEKKYLLQNQNHLFEFGLARSTDRIILWDSCTSLQSLNQQILLKYENTFKYDLVTNYRIMKDLKRQAVKESSRFLQWKKVMSKEIDPVFFSLMSFKVYTDSMKSSFSGTYSSVNHYQDLGISKSINWKVMEMLNGFWEMQSDLLFKEVDSFPLAYIEQQYKLSDYYSIGGFLPDTCFKSIFSPPLYRFRDSLMANMENLKQNILHHIELALRYIFKYTSIEEAIIEKQLIKIEKICDSFLIQMEQSLESQIEFIHASAEDFWNYRQLNSSIYSPQQQVYIEIKYIGKAYVRKVYYSIKDTTPRFVGQSLLKKIDKYLSEQSINTFIETVQQIPFEVVISGEDTRRYEMLLNNLETLEHLVAFFSLRVSSSFLIKNFHEKKQKEWDRMFGRVEEEQIAKASPINEERQRGGILRWMKNMFKKSRAESNPQSPRSNSAEKMELQKQADNQNKKVHPKQAIDEKHWLLIINTGKQVSTEKIKMAAAEGFPTRFRSSIWMYLATKNGKSSKVKLATLLTHPIEESIRKQILKDVYRTPPSKIFHYSLKQSLTRVLEGYSVYDKQIGYTQGMNFITAVILLTLTNYGEKANYLVDKSSNYGEVEEKAFKILCFLMEQKGVRRVMFVNPQLLVDLSVRLDEMIYELSPKMAEVIHNSPFGCEMIFSSPLLSCLSNVSGDIRLLKRFMDMIMGNDFFIVYKIIAQFVAHSEFMIDKITQDNMYDLLKNKMYDQVYKAVGDDGLTAILQSI